MKKPRAHAVFGVLLSRSFTDVYKKSFFLGCFCNEQCCCVVVFGVHSDVLRGGVALYNQQDTSFLVNDFDCRYAGATLTAFDKTKGNSFDGRVCMEYVAD